MPEHRESASNDPSDPARRVEEETRLKYSGAFYRPETIMRPHDAQDLARDYFGVLNRFKIDLARRFIKPGDRVLDLCCATGEHLFALSDAIGLGVGIDFSPPFIERAARRADSDKQNHLHFLRGNARRLPFPDRSFDLVYAYSALYNIPRADEAVREAGRVLRAGGRAILGFGNRASLNASVMRAHDETAEPCLLSIGEMRAAIERAGLRVEERHAFQILPMWGTKPRRLRFLLHPAWNRLMERRVGGRMIDQYLCALPLSRSWAFRQIFVCRRPEENES